MTLTFSNCRSENIGIMPIIVAELELRNVERQILAADLVIAAHDAALNQRPKAFNRVGVNGTNNMLALAMVNNTMRVAIAQAIVGGIIGRP
jgi:hypothetical protein